MSGARGDLSVTLLWDNASELRADPMTWRGERAQGRPPVKERERVLWNLPCDGGPQPPREIVKDPLRMEDGPTCRLRSPGRWLQSREGDREGAPLVGLALAVLFSFFFTSVAANAIATTARNPVSGMTMLCVTHEMGFARAVADRMVFFDEGLIVEEGPPSQIFGAPEHERTKQFLSQILH